MTGHSDKSQIDTDSLDIAAYYKGLVSYVQNCQTPMSIAIQGEWGSGKTSIMNFIKKDLKENNANYKIVEFNTWQYSQFDLGDRLPFSLIEEIVENISDKESGPRKNIFNLIKGITLFTADSLIRMGTAQIGADGVYESVKDGVKEYINSNSDFNPAKALRKLKFEFNKVIEDSCPREDDKVIVFIDDLDRLEPVKAIELLECLKLFIECDKCVFILAIDFDVVLQGVSQKYGWVSDGKSNRKKAESYFEKFIQLPFYVPINFYKTDNFIKERIQSLIELKDLRPGDMQRYKNATDNSVGSNPRSINRLINSYSLALNTIRYKGSDNNITLQGYLVLYILLCIQISFKPFYVNLTGKVVNGSEDEFKSFLNNFNSENDPEKVRVGILFSLLSDMLQSDEEESESGDKISFVKLKQLVDFTGVTETHENNILDKLNPASARFNNNFDTEERYEKLRGETSPENCELLKYFEDELGEAIGRGNFIIGSQKYQYWTIYVSDRKFAELTYKGRIGVNFGRGTLSERVDKEYYTEEWKEFVNDLRDSSDIKEIQKGQKIKKNDSMSFLLRDNSNPIRLTGISNKNEIKRAVELLKDAYGIFLQNQ